MNQNCETCAEHPDLVFSNRAILSKLDIIDKRTEEYGKKTDMIHDAISGTLIDKGLRNRVEILEWWKEQFEKIELLPRFESQAKALNLVWKIVVFIGGIIGAGVTYFIWQLWNNNISIVVKG